VEGVFVLVSCFDLPRVSLFPHTTLVPVRSSPLLSPMFRHAQYMKWLAGLSLVSPPCFRLRGSVSRGLDMSHLRLEPGVWDDPTVEAGREEIIRWNTANPLVCQPSLPSTRTVTYAAPRPALC